MEEKILYGNIETREENKVRVFRSEYNNLINTVSGDNVYAEIHNCLDTQKDYVDILHCMECNGEVVEEDGYCEKWN